MNHQCFRKFKSNFTYFRKTGEELMNRSNFVLQRLYCKKVDGSFTESGQIGEIVCEKMQSGREGNLLSAQG